MPEAEHGWAGELHEFGRHEPRVSDRQCEEHHLIIVTSVQHDSLIDITIASGHTREIDLL